MVSKYVESQNRRINALKRQLPERYTQNFVIVDRIVNENGFVGAIISGDRQLGKSMYMLKSLSQLYSGDWNEVFKHMFFDMDQFLDYLKRALEEGERVPCIALDDAGVHFGAQQYNVNREMVHYITSLLDTIGIITKSILLTVPNRTNLIKTIREGNFYSVEIHQDSGRYGRRATGYKIHQSPKGQEYLTEEFTDLYDVRIPDEQYDRYFALRQKYSLYTVVAMMEQKRKEKAEEPMGQYKINNEKFSARDISYA